MHEHRVATAEDLQHARQFLGDVRVADADQLVTRSGGISKRAEDVEDRADSHLTAGGPDESHGGMERGRIHEADANRVNTRADLVWSQLDVHTESFEQVRRTALAGHRAVTMLGDSDPGGGDDERRRRGDVERPGAVATSSAGVD